MFLTLIQISCAIFRVVGYRRKGLSGVRVITRLAYVIFLRSVIRVGQEIIGSSLTKMYLRKKQEGIASQIEWYMNGRMERNIAIMFLEVPNQCKDIKEDVADL